jgi:hypothetical protein
VHLPNDRAQIARHATQNLFRMSAAHGEVIIPSRIGHRAVIRIALHKKNKIAWKRQGATRTELLTMASHALPASHILDDDAPSARTSSQRPSLARRFYDAMIQTQQRRAQREIARVLGPRALSAAFRAELPPDR